MMDQTPKHLPSKENLATLPQTGPVPRQALADYARAVLVELGNSRDVKTDRHGRPVYRLGSGGESPEGSWQRFVVDFSAIGMATDMPFVVTAETRRETLRWGFNGAAIASTPRTATPREAAAVLTMDVLLDAFRSFVVREATLPGIP